jgi:3-hydroxybutyryl-CoA dehydrogenase
MADDIKKIAVVGAGTMGHGIAQCFAQAGYEAVIVARTQKTLDRARVLIESSLKTMAEQGILDKDSIKASLNRIKAINSLEEAVSDADIVVETIIEELEAKKKLFAQLDAYCPPRALLASNTSYINVFEFETSRQDKTVIAHWYAPPQLVPLVDVVGGPKTDKASLESIVRILKKIGKRPVLMNKYISGYVVNRLQHAINHEINFLLDNDYATPEQIDEAARGGLAIRMMVVGVVARYDFGGISMKTRHPPGFVEVPLDYEYKKLQELINKGYLGVKSGRGFYDYKGKSEEELYRERDIRLIEMLKTLKILEARGPLARE